MSSKALRERVCKTSSSEGIVTAGWAPKLALSSLSFVVVNFLLTMHSLSSCVANCAQHVSNAASLRVVTHFVSMLATVLRDVPNVVWQVAYLRVWEQQRASKVPWQLGISLLKMHSLSSLFANYAQHVSNAAPSRVGMHVVFMACTV